MARAVKAMLALFLANPIEEKKPISQPYPYCIFRKKTMEHCNK